MKNDKFVTDSLTLRKYHLLVISYLPNERKENSPIRSFVTWVSFSRIIEFKNYRKVSSLREKFISFTKVFWEQEITVNDSGNQYYKALKKVMELDDIYNEVKRKYEVIYKDLNIERNNVYYSVIMVLLVISLIFNCINITYLLLAG